MYAPNLATRLHPASRNDFFAGVCQSGCPFKPTNGWFVRYRRVPEYYNGYEAVISLLVQDLSSMFLDNLPFVIDTACDVTIIPRKLLKSEYAFDRGKGMGRAREVTGLTGNVIVGYHYPAAISIAQRQPNSSSLGFCHMMPVVVDDWKGDYGALGLDALRQVVTVADQDHISLWPKPTHTCVDPSKRECK